LSASALVVDGRSKLQITAVGGLEKLAQSRQTVDCLLPGSPLGFLASVAMIYLSVALEKRKIVDRRLDSSRTEVNC
jgi:hypothetical protein